MVPKGYISEIYLQTANTSPSYALNRFSYFYKVREANSTTFSRLLGVFYDSIEPIPFILKSV